MAANEGIGFAPLSRASVRTVGITAAAHCVHEQRSCGFYAELPRTEKYTLHTRSPHPFSPTGPSPTLTPLWVVVNAGDISSEMRLEFCILRFGNSGWVFRRQWIICSMLGAAHVMPGTPSSYPSVSLFFLAPSCSRGFDALGNPIYERKQPYNGIRSGLFGWAFKASCWTVSRMLN